MVLQREKRTAKARGAAPCPCHTPSLCLVGNPVFPIHQSWTHMPLSSAQASGGAHPSENTGRLQTTQALPSATPPRWPGSSHTGYGLRGDGSLLQAPLSPGAQGLLPLHLRGCIRCWPQGLCSWGQRVTRSVPYSGMIVSSGSGARPTALAREESTGALGSYGHRGTLRSRRAWEQRGDQPPGQGVGHAAQ